MFKVAAPSDLVHGRKNLGFLVVQSRLCQEGGAQVEVLGGTFCLNHWKLMTSLAEERLSFWLIIATLLMLLLHCLLEEQVL